MREEIGDLFSYVNKADAICLTTNGDVNRRGEAVMGRGVALQAAKRWPSIKVVLAQSLLVTGNVPTILGRVGDDEGTHVIPFPVKHHWYQRADLELIRRSAELLRALVPLEFRLVAMPRPGCGNGGLAWENVRPVLAPLLDDRFVVVELAR